MSETQNLESEIVKGAAAALPELPSIVATVQSLTAAHATTVSRLSGIESFLGEIAAFLKALHPAGSTPMPVPSAPPQQSAPQVTAL